jgi:hypothetical protein
MDYKKGYMKYKQKYLNLKKQMGGTIINEQNVNRRICNTCDNQFNNTNRKPVGLHETIDCIGPGGNSSITEHFICLECYNIARDNNQLVCRDCIINNNNIPIIDNPFRFPMNDYNPENGLFIPDLIIQNIFNDVEEINIIT